MASLVKWIGRIFIGVIVAVILAGIGAFAFEAAAEAGDAKAYPPPGKMVEVAEGRSLHLLCKGQGAGPSVVLISGGGTPSILSYPLQDKIAAFARVCSYDRPGLGWSDAGPAASFTDHGVDLDRLLTAGGVPAPYLLVPESFGGLVALSYARAHPASVAGVVFADAAEPQHWFKDVGDKPQGPQRTQLGVVGLMARLGFARHNPPDFIDGYPAQARGQLMAVYARPRPGMGEALDAAKLATPQDRAAAPGALGSTPVVVIRHGKVFEHANPAFETRWVEGQKRLAGLSSDSRILVATNNGHTLAQENPTLVADAVREVWEKAKAKTIAPPPPTAPL